MDSAPIVAEKPEYNVTGINYAQRDHFNYSGPPIIDVHAHVLRTRPTDPKEGPPPAIGPGATTDQAATMLEVAAEFGIGRVYSMCFPDDIKPLRERLADKIGFIGSIQKKLDDPDDAAYRLLDRFLEEGIEMLKFWSAPRGRDRGLFVDAPWRIESARRAQAAGIRIVMVHVSDPDVWFRTTYIDSAKYGTKSDQYVGLERMIQLFPDLIWIGAHMGGDPEHPEHLESLLERYPNLYFDTSATKWQVREVSTHRDGIRALVTRYPDRFLFGSDIVTRHHLERDHYVSRYWCQRTLWESNWKGRSPISDPDYKKESGEESPILRGVALPEEALALVYQGNARRLLRL